MATVEEVARRAVAKAGSDVGVLIASQWVNSRWKELASGVKLKALRGEGELFLPAVIDTGTVTATRGSKIVTGDTDAQGVWSVAIEGRYFRASNTWYLINQFQTTQIVLETEFGEDTVTAGSYDIIKRFHDLPTTVKHLASPMTLMRLNRPVNVISWERLNRLRPNRNAFGFPLWAAEFGTSVDGGRRIEVYPYPEDDSEVLHYLFWSDPPDLGFRDAIPGFVESYILEEGALADIIRAEGLKRLRDEKPGASEMLNEARRQETAWRNKKKESFFDEGAIDTDEMILEAFQFQHGHMNGLGFDIVTAFDHVWSR
jgi:hypothetical protein